MFKYLAPIESIEWQIINEKIAVYEYIIALYIKLNALGFRSSEVRAIISFVEAITSIREKPQVYSFHPRVLILRMCFCMNILTNILPRIQVISTSRFIPWCESGNLLLSKVCLLVGIVLRIKPMFIYPKTDSAHNLIACLLEQRKTSYPSTYSYNTYQYLFNQH